MKVGFSISAVLVSSLALARARDERTTEVKGALNLMVAAAIDKHTNAELREK